MAVTATSNIVTPQSINLPALGKLLSTAMTNTKANEGTDTLGTALAAVFTSGANGTKVPDYINIAYASTTAATPSGTTTASVARIFINNGVDNTVVTNNVLIGEIAIPSITINISTAQQTIQFPLSRFFSGLPTTWRILVGLTVAIGGTNCAVAVSAPGGGDL